MIRFWAIFLKEVRQISRDRLSLAILILVPAFLLILYGYALSFDVKHIRIAVLDENLTQQSRLLLDSLFRNPYFDRVGSLDSRAEADAWLKRGKARVVLVIPRDFSKELSRGRPGKAQALIDGSDATVANVAVGYLDALADKMTLLINPAVAGGNRAPAVIPGINIEPRIWFNPELRSAHFLIPGLMGMLLMLSAVIATSLSIVREKERETIEQINVSSVLPEELLLGKIMPYLLICLVTTLIVLGVGWFIFGVAVRGSPLLLAGATLVFLFAALGMGLLISAATKSQQEAFQLAILTTLLPSIILSGLIFPIAGMPAPIRLITLIVVPRYFVSAMRAVILKDASFFMIWPQLAAMLVLGLVFNLLAMRIMSRVR